MTKDNPPGIAGVSPACGSEAGEMPTIPGGPSPAPSRQLWHREYWDRYIRDERHYFDALRYLHENPVKARLVDRAEEWRWSSAHPLNQRVMGSDL